MVTQLEAKTQQYHREEENEESEKLIHPQAGPWKFVIIYHAAIVMLVIHLFGIYGGYLCFAAKLSTIIFQSVLTMGSILGITAGAHRLWSHKAFKAKTPLQVILMFLFLLSGQRSILTWVENHRIHHKYSDTDADPHNATRGFFFSTVGWLAVEPHPEVLKQRKLVDLSDLIQNPVVTFQHNNVEVLITMVAFVIPTYIPTLWGESLYNSFFINFFRLFVVLTISGFINSIAHLWGYKPIDKTAVGTQFTFLGLLALGEGFHNYHHVFPFDYRTSEVLDTKYNFTALFIDLMAKIGWAYDLKEVPEETVRARVLQTGDGSDKYYK